MIRMTKQRKRMLDILQNQDEPLSAETIYQQMEEGAMDLSTVYRILDTFFREGLVSKTYFDSVNYYYLAKSEHHHYMICLECHQKFEIGCHLEEIAEEIAKKHAFSISHHDMTVYGYCKECCNTMSKSS